MSGIVGDTVAQAGRREERKAQNRAKLLAAAKRVFAEKGLGEATARDIVRATDLATGTFYNYFRDKEDVFRALLAEFDGRVTAATSPVRRDTSLTVEQRIEEAGRAFFRVVAQDAELFSVLRRNFGAFRILPTDSFFASGVFELARDLRMWSEDGELPGVDTEYLSALIAGAAMQVANRMLEREDPDPEEAARFMTTALIGAIDALTAQPSPAG